jgi:hypothetical protein
MSKDQTTIESETGQQRFERILGQGPIEALKAILDLVCPDRAILHAGVLGTNSFEELLGKLGYTLNLTKQIHVQDAYSRLGREGGVKAVLPYYDIPTQSSFPTLVNFESALTTTPKAAAYFNELMGQLKKQIASQP